MMAPNPSTASSEWFLMRWDFQGWALPPPSIILEKPSLKRLRGTSTLLANISAVETWSHCLGISIKLQWSEDIAISHRHTSTISRQFQDFDILIWKQAMQWFYVDCRNALMFMSFVYWPQQGFFTKPSTSTLHPLRPAQTLCTKR